MITMKVKNTTSRAKAVRIPGGHCVIAPGKSETLELNLTDSEGERYVAAGLVFKATGKTAAEGPNSESEGQGAAKAEDRAATPVPEAATPHKAPAAPAKKG